MVKKKKEGQLDFANTLRGDDIVTIYKKREEGAPLSVLRSVWLFIHVPVLGCDNNHGHLFRCQSVLRCEQRQSLLEHQSIRD